MQRTMLASAPKVKAYLASLKGSVIDSEKPDFILCYTALLKLELLHRGVLLDSTNDLSKTLDSVTVTAGKALLDSSIASMPKTLLSGISAFAGRIAENVNTAVMDSGTYLNELSELDGERSQSARQRCRDVGDKRLYAILLIASERKLLTNVQLSERLLFLAEGYYYHAASLQPDAPIMWKRAWDTIVERQKINGKNDENSWEATFSLQNLRRIASYKGNGKRAAELGLALVQSLLNSVDCTESNVSLKGLLESFVQPYRELEPMKRKYANKMAADTVESISEESLSELDLFLLKQLSLRVCLSGEDWAIEQIAEDEIKQRENRKPLEAVIKPLSLEAVRGLVRKDYLANQDSFSEKMDKFANALRDAVLLNFADSKARINGCIDLLKYLSRMKDKYQARAYTLALGSTERCVTLEDIANFVKPILYALRERAAWSGIDESAEERIHRLEKCFNDVSVEELGYIEACALIVPFLEWKFSCSDSVVMLFDMESHCFVQELLWMLRRKWKAVAEHSQTTATVKNQVDKTDRRIQKIDLALLSTMALLALGLPSGSTSDVRRVTDAAISFSIKDVSQYSSESGGPFLSFLVAWNGLSRSPWQFCGVAEARRILVGARACLLKSARACGQTFLSVGSLLLDIAKADAEMLSIGGGLTHEVPLLYRAVMTAAKDTGRMADNLELILQSHIFSGWGRLLIREPALQFEAVNAQENVVDVLKGYLIALQRMDCEGSFYLWRSPSAVRNAACYQIAAARQRIADLLLHKGELEEAQFFLQDAVNDAPEDQNACFSLGVFQLRLMCCEQSRLPVDEKAAQMHLLRAAKLDSSRPDPFALLGYWYEESNDYKRAAGCYSKALLLDPSHPVAGRGLLRLKAGNLLGVLEKAIDRGSTLSGWAWLALATHKANVLGDDELAVVSLVNALRCRDILNPESEPLAFCYYDPLGPRDSSCSDHATALCALGSSYERLGRYTAALRSFHSAIDESSLHVTTASLISCAQGKLGTYSIGRISPNFMA